MLHSHLKVHVVVIQAWFLSPELQLASSTFNDPRESTQWKSQIFFFFCNITLEGTSQHLSYSVPQKRVPWSFPHLLLLLLSCFSRVQLCATPEMAAHQAPPSLGFSRQEHWGGCHFLLQRTKAKSESEVAQSCPTLSELMDCSLPGSSVHGIFQARVLEWEYL